MVLARRALGRTGVHVAEVGLGTWQFGGIKYGPVPEADACATIEAYLQRGGNLFDTARTYGSERILGEHFERHGGREDAFIVTKTGRNAPAEIRSEVEGTLEMLRSDYVDLYLMHAPPDDPDEMNRTLDVYEQLKDEGKIRTVGASVKGPDVSARTVELCRQYIRSNRVDVLMVIYSVFRQANAAMLVEAAEAGVGILVRSALESGFLAGKYEAGHEFAGKDHRHRWAGRKRNRILDEAQRLRQWAVIPPYESLCEVATRFALSAPGVSSVVLGARKPEQIAECVATATLPALRPVVMARLRQEYAGRDEQFNTGD